MGSVASSRSPSPPAATQTVGIDLVAMSVNDCLCAGAEPLLFLDYVAMNRDDPELTTQIVKGISDGCIEAECALLGGETAILPDIYKEGDYDLAGFCVGVVERKHILDGRDIRAGDKVIGLASSGLHSNGYSLVRKIVFEHAGLTPETVVKELGRTVADMLLEPTRIYVRAVKTVYRHYRVKRIVHGIAHITGGGLIDNPPRILPEGCSIRLRRGSWQIPPVFPWLQRLGDVDQAEMDHVFNMGIGLVLVVAEHFADAIVRHLTHQAEGSRMDHRRGRAGRTKSRMGLTEGLFAATSADSPLNFLTSSLPSHSNPGNFKCHHPFAYSYHRPSRHSRERRDSSSGTVTGSVVPRS